MNPKRIRSPIQRERDLAEVARLVNLHPFDSERRLHQRFNASRSVELQIWWNSFRTDLNLIKSRWRQAQDVSAWHGRVAQQILFAQQEFMDAWQASKREMQSSITRRVLPPGAKDTDENAGSRLVELRTEQTHGDPRYLIGYIQCVDRITKLFGLEPAARSQIDLKLIEREVAQVAREVHMDPAELMHQMEAVVLDRWRATEGGDGSEIASAFAIDASTPPDIALDDAELDI